MRAKAATPILSVVVVTYRRLDLLETCLASVASALDYVAVPTEMVVVDNGSRDGTDAFVRARFPDARLITIDDNIGFARAVSRGIGEARGRWIVLLNDDVSVDSHTFRALIEAVHPRPDVGAVAAQMRFADRPQTINSAGIDVDRLGVAADRLLGVPAEGSEHEPVEVFGASGGAALYRREMLADVGGFDESFFAYLEDVDLAWRARMAGWRTLYEPGAVVYHHHSATLVHGSAQKYFLVGRNRVRLLAKNATREQLLRYGLAMLVYDAAYVAYVATKHRTLAPLRGRLRGVREWRQYRQLGAMRRRAVDLRPVLGYRSALRRDKVWARDAVV